MNIQRSFVSYLSVFLCSFLCLLKSAEAAPPLQKGVWARISPPEVVMTAENHVFSQGMAIDPDHPTTIYLCICAYDVSKAGLFKTINGGSTWKKVGQLDEPIHIAIDPKNTKHLCCVDGVRGNTVGYWVSNDGGDTWTQPAGFQKVTEKPVGTRDLYSIAVDPTDFKHQLVSFHSPWSGYDKDLNCGVLETTDCGESWVVHNPPPGSARGYGMAVFFLFDPIKKIGNSKTWLFTTQSAGFYKTSDGGATWSEAYKLQMTHGGCQLYRTANGSIYAGGYQYPVRSDDNGTSWHQIKQGLVYSWYIGICGDGTNLFTASSNEKQPFFFSPETDGEKWIPYGGADTAQKFSAVPFEMVYDKQNDIMYAASWHEGLLALKNGSSHK